MMRRSMNLVNEAGTAGMGNHLKEERPGRCPAPRQGNVPWTHPMENQWMGSKGCRPWRVVQEGSALLAGSRAGP